MSSVCNSDLKEILDDLRKQNNIILVLHYLITKSLFTTLSILLINNLGSDAVTRQMSWTQMHQSSPIFSKH